MGQPPHLARTQALRFRRHSIELLEQMAPHQQDERRLIAIAKQGRAQLEQLWAREREERRRAPPTGWGGTPRRDNDADPD
jgi:glutathione-regulated potassium-efflux system ancillary protein KefC